MSKYFILSYESVELNAHIAKSHLSTFSNLDKWFFFFAVICRILECMKGYQREGNKQKYP